MRAALTTEISNAAAAVDLAASSPSLVGRDLAVEVTTPRPYEWGEDTLERRSGPGYTAGRERAASTRELLEETPGRRARVAALDFGLKHNILDLLVAGGCDVTVFPATTGSDELLAGDFDGIFLSNGPGDPDPVTYGIETVGSLLGKIPVFGICLGHQILALALGGRTYKLPFGHRGGNHPVRRLDHERVEITCQNHGFAVDAASIEATAAGVTHVNLNDGTVEGIEVPGLAFSVQYHPESGPGPHDSRYLFTKFRRLMTDFEPRPVDREFEAL